MHREVVMSSIRKAKRFVCLAITVLLAEAGGPISALSVSVIRWFQPREADACRTNVLKHRSTVITLDIPRTPQCSVRCRVVR